MTATLIDGKAFSAMLRAQIATATATLTKDHNLIPGLAVILVGEDPASQVYVRNKNKGAVEAGMRSFEYILPATTDQKTLMAKIADLNADPTVHGILVQLPLPTGLDEQAVIAAISPSKDVDGFHPLNVGALATGSPTLVPCTPLGCLMMLRDVVKDGLAGKRAIVVGRSNIVGKPMAHLLLSENCTVTIAHSRTKDLAAECKRADILIAAVGRPHFIRGEWIKPGAVVIDVGINRVDDPAATGKTRLTGDVCFEEAKAVAAALTPVPGGVGPMTIAVLLRNTLAAACQQHAVSDPLGPLFP